MWRSFPALRRGGGALLGAYTVWVYSMLASMKTRLIKLNIVQDQALYDDLMSAMMEHRQYDGCYIMQYSEYRGDLLQMVGEFILREPES